MKQAESQADQEEPARSWSMTRTRYTTFLRSLKENSRALHKSAQGSDQETKLRLSSSSTPPTHTHTTPWMRALQQLLFFKLHTPHIHHTHTPRPEFNNCASSSNYTHTHTHPHTHSHTHLFIHRSVWLPHSKVSCFRFQSHFSISAELNRVY